jgi:hypothetical protein
MLSSPLLSLSLSDESSPSPPPSSDEGIAILRTVLIVGTASDEEFLESSKGDIVVLPSVSVTASLSVMYDPFERMLALAVYVEGVVRNHGATRISFGKVLLSARVWPFACVCTEMVGEGDGEGEVR